MTITGTQLFGMAEAIYSAKDTNDQARADWAVGGQCLCYTKLAADAMAADTSDVGISCQVASPYINGAKVISVKYLTQANLTAHDTNYATLSLVYDDGAGGSETTVASQTTKITGGSGNWTAGNMIDIPVSAAIIPAAGKQLRFKIAKAASGVVVPVGVLCVNLIYA